MKRTLGRTIAIAVAAAGIALTNTSAYADGSNVTAYTQQDSSGTSGGEVTFKPYGEHLYIVDDVKNGESVVAHMQYGSKDQWWFNSEGAGTTRHLNFDIAEGTEVAIAACRGHWKGSVAKSEIWACGVWKVTTA
ncbi:hypothetical protein ABT063_27470 [Streptomyces sp. NPDC002838]|uniref:hypothetical protein n=1 Tax=Streptomyces sp. NPDC002838 TaxID=3154436 RepID=UPI00332DD3A6